jgi:DNA repair protein SbcD/Mre11
LQVKIIHAADFHLESPFTGLSTEKAERRREELKETFLRVIDLCIKEEAQILLLAGDLFEHEKAGKELMHFLNQGFNKIKAKVFIAPGNHDPGLPTSPYWVYPWSSNVHIFREKFETIELRELGCRVHGLGYCHFAVKERHLANFRVPDHELIDLVLLHGEAKTSPLASENSNYLPFTIAEMAEGGANYYALGHHHRARVVWEERGNPKACYSGSPEPLGYDEEGEHGVYCGYVGKDKNELRFVKLNQRSYRTIQVPCCGEEFMEELAMLAQTTIPEVDRSRDFIRLVFSGETEPSLEFDRSKLESLLAPHFYHCKVENATVPRYELDIFDQRTARGMFISKLNAMLEQAVDEDSKEIFRQSLYMGLDALNLGKVVER